MKIIRRKLFNLSIMKQAVLMGKDSCCVGRSPGPVGPQFVQAPPISRLPTRKEYLLLKHKKGTLF